LWRPLQHFLVSVTSFIHLVCIMLVLPYSCVLFDSRKWQRLFP
jgi:hypothetical protein